MNFFTVDEATCTRCGICVDECPVGGIIELKDIRPVPTPTDKAEELCITCGHCVAVCPSGSFSLSAMPAGECPPLVRSMLPEPEQVDHLMRARRSVRRYKDKQVSRDTISALIETASHIPTGHNRQEVEWLVVYDNERVRELSAITIRWMEYLVKENHPAAEMLGVRRLIGAWGAGIDPICRNAPHLVVTQAPRDNPIAHTDCISALTWFELAASANSLGACWAGFVMACAAYWPPMQETLGLPEGNALFGAMMIGHPKYDYHRLPKRKEPPIIWQ